MDDKDFRKHLRDLAHGKHHPAEHDWDSGEKRAAAPGSKTKSARPAKRRSK